MSGVANESATLDRYAAMPGAPGFGWHVVDRDSPNAERVAAGPFTTREAAFSAAADMSRRDRVEPEPETLEAKIVDAISATGDAVRSLALQADRYDGTLATIMADAATLKARVDELERALHDDPGRHSVKA